MTKLQERHHFTADQQGSVLIIMMLILIVGVASVMLSGIAGITRRPAVEIDPVTKQALLAAKEQLIAWSAMRGIANSADVPPGLLPYPDNRLSDNNYDGNSDCFNGVPIPIPAQYRIGRLPINGESSPCRSWIGSPSSRVSPLLNVRDSANEVIWYSASNRLMDDYNSSFDTINSRLTLGETTQWLTVCDQQGNLISNQVAFVLIAPGPRLPGQTRPAVTTAATPAPTANNYLESYALPLSGVAPCNNPLESNYDQNDVFVLNSGLSTQFNDQVLYVTKQEFFGRVTQALAKNISNQLREYFQNTGNVFPNPAAEIPNDGSCVDTTPPDTYGRLPVQCHPLDSSTPPFMVDTSASVGWYGSIRYKVNDGTRQKVTISFEQCAITYTYEWTGTSFEFKQSGSKC